jgi:hypothetical protein
VNTRRIEDWLNSVQGWLHPPGCVSEYAALPTNESGCCGIGLVHEHRFAFYYWALHSHGRACNTPTLVTLDSHNDVGVPRYVPTDDLNHLDITNRAELGLFTWIGLPRNNDGHILPALYLNFFSDVYVLFNKDQDSPGSNTDSTIQQIDNAGIEHEVTFFRDANDLLRALPQNYPISLDIDLDFFTVKNPDGNGKLGSELLKPDEEIRSFLSLSGSFMKPILSQVVGLTVALEPRCCGGLMNSLHVLEILNQEFFDGTLCTDSCKWKSRVGQGNHD